MVLDDPVAGLRRPERLGGDVLAGDVVLERLVADEPGVPERLLGAQLAFGVLQPQLGLRQPGGDFGERLGLGDVGLDLGQDVARLHHRAVAHVQADDPAGDDRLDLDLRHRVDDADLPHAHLQVLGGDGAEPERQVVGRGCRFFLAVARGEDDTGADENDSEGRGEDPLLLHGAHSEISEPIRARVPFDRGIPAKVNRAIRRSVGKVRNRWGVRGKTSHLVDSGDQAASCMFRRMAGPAPPRRGPSPRPSSASFPAEALDPAKAITQYRHEVWRTREGLPQSSAEALVQTRDGYVWIGTQEGLARFDGVRFVVFDKSTTPELRHNRILSLLEDRRGRLWIGTEGGGLTVLEEGRFRTFGRTDGLSADIVRALAEDAEGTLWIGTDSGLQSRDERSFTTWGASDGVPAAVRSLVIDLAGTLWAGTGQGLIRRSGKKFVPAGLRDAVLSLHAAADGTILAGTPHGLRFLREGRVEALSPADGLPSEVVNCTLRDRRGTVWIGTSSGLARWASGRLSVFTPAQGLSNGNVLALLEDREGTLWVGTQDGGLNKLSDASFTPWGVREGLSADVAWAVFVDRDGAVWSGTDSAGVNVRRGDRVTTIGTADGLAAPGVQAIWQHPDGSVWLGTRGGRGQHRPRREGREDDPQVGRPRERFDLCDRGDAGRERLPRGARAAG